MKWEPIETIPADYSDEDPPRVLVWVANGGPDGKGDWDAGWCYLSRSTGKKKPRAASYQGTGWKITHWAHVDMPDA